MGREYELVIEFDSRNMDDFDNIIGFEHLLRDALPGDELEGRDVANAFVNVFILTDDPHRCFGDAMRALDGADPAPTAAGFRRRGHDHFVRLWPADDWTTFVLR